MFPNRLFKKQLDCIFQILFDAFLRLIAHSHQGGDFQLKLFIIFHKALVDFSLNLPACSYRRSETILHNNVASIFNIRSITSVRHVQLSSIKHIQINETTVISVYNPSILIVCSILLLHAHISKCPERA